MDECANGRVTRIEFANETVCLLPGRAVYRPSSGELLIADLHLGKGHTFRQAGRPVPSGGSAADLHRLSMMLEITGAKRLMILGDLIHHTLSAETEVGALLHDWLVEHERYEPTLVPGNHDRHAKNLLESLPLVITENHHEAGGMEYRHQPPESAEQPWIAGHIHPGVRFGSGPDTMRSPIFWVVQGRGLIVPAFGSFTGLYRPRIEPGDTVYAVGNESVIEIPYAAL